MTSAQSVSHPRVATSRQKLPAWQALQRHVDEMQGVTLHALFDQDPARARDLAFETCGIFVDLSKHRITHTTVRLLLDLVQQCDLTQRRDAMFAGKKINFSEHRAVLHVALRAPRDAVITVDGHNVVPEAHQVLDPQGLPDGVGVALAGKYLEQRPYRVWVLCGDSELAEGSIWEALDKASYYQLSNQILMVDVNRLGQRGQTDLGWNLDAYARRVEAFGARALLIDGHDLAAIDNALATAEDSTASGQPTVIVAKTIKGRGFSEVEDSPDWHGKPLPPDMAQRAITELSGVRNLVLRGPRPAPAPATKKVTPNEAGQPAKTDATPPRYAVGDKVATRKAYGDALVALGARDPQVLALDGEVSNSTYAREFASAYPQRYFEMFIAEQQLVAAATGLAVRGYRSFASTFAAFWTRAYDFIRMAPSPASTYA